MFFKIAKILFLFSIIGFSILAFLFFRNPHSIIYLYIENDQKTISVETRFLPFKKKILDHDNYKSLDWDWSSDGRFFSFFEYVALEPYNKEWALKIIDARFFTTKTIFIGDYRTSEYKWLNNNIIRVYARAGSGVRAYRDINIDLDQPVIMVDDWSSGNWTLEKTY